MWRLSFDRQPFSRPQQRLRGAAGTDIRKLTFLHGLYLLLFLLADVDATGRIVTRVYKVSKVNGAAPRRHTGAPLRHNSSLHTREEHKFIDI